MMTVVTATQSAHWKPFGLFSSIFTSQKSHNSNSEISDDESRERRGFVLEMMAAHPGAFQSELDTQVMLHFYSERF